MDIYAEGKGERYNKIYTKNVTEKCNPVKGVRE